MSSSKLASRGVQQVCANPRRAAGVVDERVHRAKSRLHVVDQSRAIVGGADIGTRVVHVGPGLSQGLEHVGDVALRA